MAEYDKTIFARNLNQCMEEKGVKQTDICALLSVSKSTVSSWCSGEKMPRMDKVETLADYFGIQKSDLIEEKGAFTQKEEAPAISVAEALRIFAESKKGSPLTQEELNGLDRYVDIYIKSLEK